MFTFAHVLDDIPFQARIAGLVGLLALISAALLLGQVPLDWSSQTTRALPVAGDPFQEIGFGGPELTADLPFPPSPLTLIPKRNGKNRQVPRAGGGYGLGQRASIRPQARDHHVGERAVGGRP